MQTQTDPWGNALSEDEAATLLTLAGLTGRPAGQVIRQVNRSRLAQAQFQIAVTLATGKWEWRDWLGRWKANPAKQQEELARYAASLVEDYEGTLWPAGVMVSRGREAHG